MYQSTLAGVLVVCIATGCAGALDAAVKEALDGGDATQEASEPSKVEAAVPVPSSQAEGNVLRPGGKHSEHPLEIVAADPPAVTHDASVYNDLFKATLRHFERSKSAGTVKELFGWCLRYQEYFVRASALSGESPYELAGIAMRESSCGQFLTGPAVRGSSRRAQGLMGIFNPPKEAVSAAKIALNASELDWGSNALHNVVVGAFTYRHYKATMPNQTYALLAYHNGPDSPRIKTKNETGTLAEFCRIVRHEHCYADETPGDCALRKQDICDYPEVALGYAHMLKETYPEFAYPHLRQADLDKLKKDRRKTAIAERAARYPGIDGLQDAVTDSDRFKPPTPVVTADRGTVTYRRPKHLSIAGVAERFLTTEYALRQLNGGMSSQELMKSAEVVVPGVQARLTYDVFELSEALYGHLPTLESLRMFFALNGRNLKYGSFITLPILPQGKLAKLSKKSEKQVNESVKKAKALIAEDEAVTEAAKVPIAERWVSWGKR